MKFIYRPLKILRKPVSPSVQSTLDLLMDSATWDTGRLQEMQFEKMQKLLDHAWQTCPWYRRQFDQLGLRPDRDFPDLECISKLPVLAKTDIQQHCQEMLTTDPRVSGIELNSTGGSTGQPLNFYQDDNYRTWSSASATRAWRRHSGIADDGIEAVLWGAVRDIGRGLRLKSLLKNVVRYRCLPLNTFDLDETLLRKYLRIYNLVRPPILRGYATSLYFVAEFIAANGLQVHQPQIIISSAEVLRPHMRTKISEVFGADIIDSYGCREVAQIATECHRHCGLHLVMETQYVEIVDGNIIVTNLDNLGMPFIRYQVGDSADRIVTESCRCGRHAYRITSLLGRNNDNIELPNGKVVNGEFFEFLFFGLTTVERFQVVYSRKQKQLRVRLQVSDHSEYADKMVAQKMKDAFDFDNIKFEFSDKFDVTPTGKFRFVYAVDDFEPMDE